MVMGSLVSLIWSRLMVLAAACATCAVLISTASAQNPPHESGEAQWIWAAGATPGQVERGACFFRKSLRLGAIESAQVEITCDDRYELFVNGRMVGQGADWKSLAQYDIAALLTKGRNCIAVRAENTESGAAGLVARVTIKGQGDTDVSYSTDSTWKASREESPRWQSVAFDDSQWQAARSLGELGRTPPWNSGVSAAAGASTSRFTISPEFRVERVVSHEQSGSVVAMAFNERGEIIASRESGPLVLVRGAGHGDRAVEVRPLGDQVRNCQGILSLNGQIYAVGEGADGAAFYRLVDDDRDGEFEEIKTLVKFKGGMGEHGPHAPILGPDGFIYLIVGNHASADVNFDPQSPHRNYYEGDLLQPRYEDAGGHAVGIKAPGGTVIRTDHEGSFVELFAGGFRNAYDIAFNRQGDLFTYDSDMEWDVGLPWYRPTRINHVVAGAEFGWRSGWAKWPGYFVDSLGTTLDIGRGSPTGVEFYNHYMFPVRYHNVLFACDWSLGRILAIRLKPQGGSYEARSEVFLQGRPLAVTDLAVGPDGWLYFSTGGRGTEGGIYRIVWTGNVPPQPSERGVMEAVRQPQLHSAWGRNRVARIKQQLGDRWDEAVREVATDAQHAADDRMRALDLMQLVGPFPTAELLVELSRDVDAAVRAKAVYLMGIHFDEPTTERLEELLDDADATVRRHACESFVRRGAEGPAEKLAAMLDDADHHVAWAAKLALSRLPTSAWQAAVLETDSPRAFSLGATELMAIDAQRSTIDPILSRCGQIMKGDVSDDDYVRLLRVVQLALYHGKITGEEMPELRHQLAEDYPSLEPRMNRELVRILVYLQDPSIAPRLLSELANSNMPIEERLHAACYARFLQAGWPPEGKLSVLKFLEDARQLPGGHSFVGYLDNISRDFVATLDESRQNELIGRAREMPAAALSALATLPERPDGAVLAELEQLDVDLQGQSSEAAKRLRTGIVAVFGRSLDPRAMAYLRDAFEREPDRRAELAMGLAQDPSEENWPYLVRALPIVEGAAAQEVLMKLADADLTPDQPEPLRQVILCGLKLGANGGHYAATLLEKWTGEQLSKDDDAWDVALRSWQDWFAESFPDEPAATLPVEAEGTRWSRDELLAFLASDAGSAGDHRRGELVFEKAQCVKCHRYGDHGEGIGPDLSAVSQRFQKKEIIEAVLFPSQIISDQYASKSVLTVDGRTVTGIVAPSGEDAIVVLQANGEKLRIANDDVEEIMPSKASSMPDGLFNTLSLEEIADLFAYMGRPLLSTAGSGGSGRGELK